jgi:putative membrane protein
VFSSWDQAAIAWLLLLGLMYASGVRRLRARGTAPPPLERAAFAGGWVALLGAVLPWLDAAALARFSAHMAQHELMMIVGAPLLVASRPVATSLWALPDNWRQRAAAASRNRWMRRLVDRATLPWVAWAGHGLAVWIWHAPVLYGAALQNEGVHAMQHAMFTGASILFWSGLLNGRYGRAGYGAAVLYVFTTAVHTGTLGALLTIAPNPIYAEYVAQGGNGNALADQQVAGLLMWIPAGLLMTIFGLALLAAWIGAAERRNGFDRVRPSSRP